MLSRSHDVVAAGLCQHRLLGTLCCSRSPPAQHVSLCAQHPVTAGCTTTTTSACRLHQSWCLSACPPKGRHRPHHRLEEQVAADAGQHSTPASTDTGGSSHGQVDNRLAAATACQRRLRTRDGNSLLRVSESAWCSRRVCWGSMGRLWKAWLHAPALQGHTMIVLWQGIMFVVLHIHVCKEDLTPADSAHQVECNFSTADAACC